MSLTFITGEIATNYFDALNDVYTVGLALVGLAVVALAIRWVKAVFF